MQIKQSQYRGPESRDLTEFVEHALRTSLKRLGSRIRSTVVSLHDLNGLRGGIDQECRITVRTTQGPPIVITERNSSMRAAVERAAERVREAVRRRAGFRLSPVVSYKTFISKRDDITTYDEDITTHEWFDSEEPPGDRCRDQSTG